MRRELDRYDMSLRAFVLGYDSWFIGTYLRAMRLAVYYKCKSHIIYKLLGGSQAIMRWTGRRLGFQIPATADIGFGITIYHWGNIVINSRAVIGRNFCVYPGVCIGQKASGVPTIGDNVTFFTNSGAYGGIRIGNNVVVAPNAVVTHDVPDNCVVAGVPARILRHKEARKE